MPERRTLTTDHSKKELLTHGSYDFPVEIFPEQLDLVEGGFVDWHWHEEIQIVVVTKGSIRFYSGKNNYLLNTGDGLFINSMVLHSAKPAGEADSTYLCIDFHPSLLQRFRGYIFDRNYIEPYIGNALFQDMIFRPDRDKEKEILDLLMHMGNIHRQKDFGYELDILSLIFQFWAAMIKLDRLQQSSKVSSEYESQRIRKLLDIIQDNYMNKIRLEELADNIGMNKTACCRYFKKKMGISIFDYINDYRIRQSIHDLSRSDHSISEIAYDNGFSTTSYFIKKFREKTGYTPLEFRRLESH